MEWCWCYETGFEFRSLMARAKKLILSLSVFAIMLLHALARWQQNEETVVRVIWVLDYFISSAFAVFEVDVLQRGESRPEMRSAKCTALCGALQSFRLVDWSRFHTTLRCTFYGPWIESFQDCWWDPEFLQLSQMVQSLPCFLNLNLNVCGPSQVLGDVYTEVLEATHPLHRGPTDHKRSVGPLLSLPEVHNQLFSFTLIQRETVVLAPWCKSLYLIQVCGLIVFGNEAQNYSIH